MNDSANPFSHGDLGSMVAVLGHQDRMLFSGDRL
jgi:hypothetical protein